MPDISFKKQLVIDKYALDEAVINQPELYADWACRWADAVNDRDRAKDNLSLIRGECDEDIRNRPGDFGWKADKAPTEAFISAAISGHVDYMAANEAYLETVHEVNTLVVAKDSFEQRSKMIGELVKLYVSGYFSGNKAIDKGYAGALEKIVEKDISEALEKNPRLIARRKQIEADRTV